MNKKGNIVFAVIFIVVIIAVITFLVILGIKKDVFRQERKIEQIKPNITRILLSIEDSETEQQLNGRYILGYYIESEIPENRVFIKISEGPLTENSFTIVDYPLNTSIYFYGMNETYYTNVLRYNPILIIDPTPPKLILKLDKRERAVITSTAQLEEGTSDVKLKIKSTENYNRINLCFGYSIGIIKADLNKGKILCPTSWLNYSHCNEGYFNEKTNTCNNYVYYPNFTYRCLDTNELRLCDETEGRICYLPKKRDVPSFLKNKADECIETGESLKNSELSMDVKVKANQITCDDKLSIYIFDEDLQLKDNQLSYIPNENYNYTILTKRNCIDYDPIKKYL